MRELATDHGAEVIINKVPFFAALKLQDAVLKALLIANIDVAAIDLSPSKGDSAGVNQLISAILSVIGSEALRKELFICMQRSTCDGVKITPDLFESEEMRPYYYEIAGAVLMENISDFFVRLLSKSAQAMENIGIKSLKLPAA